MQLRSGRTTMATPPCDGDGNGDNMNASLWGELQSFIDLSIIFAKLPLAPFFRLRQVCKEWNRLASDRQFLEQNFKPPISSLYFVVARRTGHRLLTSQDSLWTSSPMPRRRCEVSGLLYKDSDRHRVFDLHTRVFYSLPPLPSDNIMDDGSIVGMTVDTTLIPYGFRVFITKAFETSIYDSNSGTWTTTTSTSSCMLSALPSASTLSCVHYEQFLYMLVEKNCGGGCFVHRYDLEKHVWWYDVYWVSPTRVWENGGIGMWRDKWFAFGTRASHGLRAWQMNIRICTNSNLYAVFAFMPNDLGKWMMRDTQSIFHSLFFGEQVLAYNCLEAEERAVLYNLERETWNKIVPQSL